jgi:hypothetical protein
LAENRLDTADKSAVGLERETPPVEMGTHRIEDKDAVGFGCSTTGDEVEELLEESTLVDADNAVAAGMEAAHLHARRIQAQGILISEDLICWIVESCYMR